MVAKARKMESLNFCVYESKISTLGMLLLVIGVYYLGKNLGWWPEVPFWPLVLIIAGLYLVLKKISYKKI